MSERILNKTPRGAKMRFFRANSPRRISSKDAVPFYYLYIFHFT